MARPLDLFLEKLQTYRDPKYRLLGDGPFCLHPSGNALLYEAHAGWIRKDLGGDPWGPGSPFNHAIALLVGPKNGLFRRKPRPAEDPQTHDDYVGVTSLDSAIGVFVHFHGESRGYWYNWKDEKETFWDGFWAIFFGVQPLSYADNWHGRLAGVPQHYQISAGSNPGFIGWIMWLGALMATTLRANNESGWLLRYLMLRCALEVWPEKRAVKWANTWYQWRLKRCYGGQIQNVYAVYFKADHPFAEFAHWPVT